VVFIVTDGFEDYLSSSEFVSLFLEWSETLEERFEKYCEKKIGENPKTFGHERTLIAISI
jgi:serine/threonine protein phosphatase PrpC